MLPNHDTKPLSKGDGGEFQPQVRKDWKSLKSCDDMMEQSFQGNGTNAHKKDKSWIGLSPLKITQKKI